MTNLSKELCELCGIEKTVDFTKPANFVRLFNLKVYECPDACTIAYLITSKHSIDTVEEFLYYLHHDLKTLPGLRVFDIKQSIREGEWVHE